MMSWSCYSVLVTTRCCVNSIQLGWNCLCWTEAFLTTCTFDYLTDSNETRLFVAGIFTFAYIVPLSILLFFYSKIVGKVRHHEQALREQAKKMNVSSLRSNKEQNEESAEVRIAKVAISLSALFLVSWTPYACVALTGAFGDRWPICLLSSWWLVPTCYSLAVPPPQNGSTVDRNERVFGSTITTPIRNSLTELAVSLACPKLRRFLSYWLGKGLKLVRNRSRKTTSIQLTNSLEVKSRLIGSTESDWI